jgi:hypothetical protein
MIARSLVVIVVWLPARLKTADPCTTCSPLGPASAGHAHHAREHTRGDQTTRVPNDATTLTRLLV